MSALLALELRPEKTQKIKLLSWPKGWSDQRPKMSAFTIYTLKKITDLVRVVTLLRTIFYIPVKKCFTNK